MAGEDRIGGPYLLLLAGAAAGVGVLLTSVPLHLSAGVLGTVLLLGAVLRLVSSRPGDLAVRSKAIDVLTLGGLGCALVLSGALMVVL